MIDIQTYRARIGLHCCRHFKVKGLMYLSFFELMIILSLLLLRSGDVEPNPGPEFSGFRGGRSTTGQIFNLRIQCKKYLQHQQNLYHVFIDLKKKPLTEYGMQPYGPPRRSAISVQI